MCICETAPIIDQMIDTHPDIKEKIHKVVCVGSDVTRYSYRDCINELESATLTILRKSGFKNTIKDTVRARAELPELDHVNRIYLKILYAFWSRPWPVNNNPVWY